jgi:hypothetical protein
MTELRVVILAGTVARVRRLRASATLSGIACLILFTAASVAGQQTDSRTVTVSCRFDRPSVIVTKGQTRVTMAGCQTYHKVGEPSLPFRSIRVMLPPGYGDVCAAVPRPSAPVLLGGKWSVEFGRTPLPLNNLPLSPGAGVAEDVADPAIYNSTNVYPASLVQLDSVQHMCGSAIAVIRVFPVQYLPASGQLRFFPNLDVEVTISTVTKALAEETVTRPDMHVPSRVAGIVDNPEMLGEYNAGGTGGNLTSSQTYDYLLVTRASLLPAFQPLIDRKIADGLTVKTETMETILTNSTGRDSAEKLRNYIKTAYTNWGIDYVLLGGDSGTVPCRHVYARCGGITITDMPCDLYFACLDGSWDSNGDNIFGTPTDGEGGGDVDMMAEVYVGRAPVDTPEEVSNFVAKVVDYEVNGTEHAHNVCFAGESLNSSLPQVQGGDGLDHLLTNFNGYAVQWLDDRYFTTPQWNAGDAVAALNLAPNLVVHNGHGESYELMRIQTPDLNSLTNRNLFLINSAGCNVGAFDNDQFSPDCIGEDFVKLKTYGAFSAILNSRLGWYDKDREWQFSGEFQSALFNELLNKGCTNIGMANQLAKQDMLGSVETSGTSMPYRWCYFEITLFGDPHTPIHLTNSFQPVPVTVGIAPADGSSLVLTWNSSSNKYYSVYRATNLCYGGFVALTNHLAATPPMNTYTDTVTGINQAFYRIRVEP